jgi:hypothetical protein
MKTDSTSTRSFLETMTAIAWSFVGLRRKRDFDSDVGRMNPVYVIIAGLAGAACFIATLLAIVHNVVP